MVEVGLKVRCDSMMIAIIQKRRERDHADSLQRVTADPDGWFYAILSIAPTTQTYSGFQNERGPTHAAAPHGRPQETPELGAPLTALSTRSCPPLPAPSDSAEPGARISRGINRRSRAPSAPEGRHLYCLMGGCVMLVIP